MFVLFSVFQIELNSSANIVVSLVYGQFNPLSFFGSVFEYFGFFLFIEGDFNIDRPGESSEEVRDFILNKPINLPSKERLRDIFIEKLYLSKIT